MGVINREETPGSVFREFERRLHALETAPRLPNATMKGGAFRVVDSNGILRAVLGQLGDDFGVAIYDEDGGLRFEIIGDGYHDPWLSHPWRNQITPDRASTTSGTFTDLWTSRVELITHKGAASEAAWVTDASTTGEVRLREIGGATTSAVSVAAGSSGSQQFKWLHGVALGTGPATFAFQARRTGGAGSVHLDQPNSALEMADPLQCTASGL